MAKAMKSDVQQAHIDVVMLAMGSGLYINGHRGRGQLHIHGHRGRGQLHINSHGNEMRCHSSPSRCGGQVKTIWCSRSILFNVKTKSPPLTSSSQSRGPTVGQIPHNLPRVFILPKTFHLTLFHSNVEEM